MPVESWMNPEEVPVAAAAARAAIDAALCGLSETQRDAFWASIRKCYNTPYNDPAPRKVLIVADAIVMEPVAEVIAVDQAVSLPAIAAAPQAGAALHAP